MTEISSYITMTTCTNDKLYHAYVYLLLFLSFKTSRDIPPDPPRGSVLKSCRDPARVISCLSLPTAWGQCNKHALCVNALYLWYYVLVTVYTDFPLLLSQAEHFLWWLLLCQSGDTGEWGGPPGDSFQTAGHCTQAHALTWGGCVGCGCVECGCGA